MNIRSLAWTLVDQFSSVLRKKGKGCLFSYEEHGPLQMFGPANEVSSPEKHLCHVDSSDSCVFAI